MFDHSSISAMEHSLVSFCYFFSKITAYFLHFFSFCSDLNVKNRGIAGARNFPKFPFTRSDKSVVQICSSCGSRTHSYKEQCESGIMRTATMFRLELWYLCDSYPKHRFNTPSMNQKLVHYL